MISKTKVIVFSTCLILSVPLTLISAEWMLFKIAKQTLNCGADTLVAVQRLPDESLSDISGIETEQIIANKNTCLKNIDPRMGLLKFVDEEL